MKILQVNLNTPEKNTILGAVDVLKTRGLVVYPTDTAYGIGGNALNQGVIKKVYEAQGRDKSKPTHVIIRDWQMVEKIAHTTPLSKLIFDKFLPGPLTLILNKKNIVPDELTGGLPTIGVRLPNCKVTIELSKQLPFPYTTPSANKSGSNTPYSTEEVEKELGFDMVDLVLDAGELAKTKPSTLLDLSGKTPKILRAGPVSKERIEKVVNITID